MFDGFKRETFTIDGSDIACAVGGSGPPVLMLHGFPQNLTMWARVAPQLASRFTIVCADLRGYGASGKPRCQPDRSNYSFRAFAADQVGVMRRLGFERPGVLGTCALGPRPHYFAGLSSLPGTDASAALKPIFECVPSQKGFFVEAPHRHR